MADLITRTRWAARPPQGSRNALDPNPKGVAIHWNGPGCAAALRTHDKCAPFLRSIQAFHMGPQRGWSDIAYSLFACPHGHLFEGRGKGIGTAANGTNYGNRYFYAIYAMWGEGDGYPPAPLLDAIADGVALCRSWGAGSLTVPHSHFLSTSCPGRDLTALTNAGRFAKPPTAQQGDEIDMATIDDLSAAIRAETDPLAKRLDALEDRQSEHIDWTRKAVNAALWGGPSRTVERLAPVLAKATGVDQAALAAAVADAIRDDVKAAVAAAGSGATADQVADELARRLTQDAP